MLRKTRLIAVTVLLLSILVQPIGNYFIPKALAVTPTGYSGIVIPWNDATPIFSSKNNDGGVTHVNGTGKNPPSAIDEITYRFQLTKDFKSTHNRSIILGFDSDESGPDGTGGKQYNLRAVSQPVISANPSWLSESSRIRVENADGDDNTDDCDVTYNNNADDQEIYGGEKGRCIIINLNGDDVIPANTPITITVKVGNPSGVGWYPVGLLAHYANTDDGCRGGSCYIGAVDAGNDGRADDRIQVGDPTWDRPNDTGNGCKWNDFGCWIVWLINAVFGIINAGISLLTKVLVAMAAFIMAIFIKVTTGDDVYAAIKVGFDLFLQIANFGLIVGIILIAFMTMLRRENYTISRTLPQLIIIALLINFSWFIAVWVITLSNNIGLGILLHVGGIDLDNIGGSFSDFGSKFAISSLNDVGSSSSGGGIFNAVIGGIILVIVNLLLGLIIFFALIMVSIMLLIRWINLSMSLILMPIAILSRIFPNIGSASKGSGWDAWLNKFTKWVLYFPASAFFIGISLQIMEYVNGLTFEGEGSAIQNIVWGILVVGILISGLSMAEKMGLSGAKATQNISGILTRRFLGLNALAGMAGKRLAGGRLAGLKGIGAARPGAGGPPGAPSAASVAARGLALQQTAVPGSTSLSFPIGKKLPMAGGRTFADIAPTMDAVGTQIGAGAGTQLAPGTTINAPGANIQTGKPTVGEDYNSVQAKLAAAVKEGLPEDFETTPANVTLDTVEQPNLESAEEKAKRAPGEGGGWDKLKETAKGTGGGILGGIKKTGEAIAHPIENVIKPGAQAVADATVAAGRGIKAGAVGAAKGTVALGDKALYHTLDTPAKIGRGIDKGAIATGNWLTKYAEEGKEQSVSKIINKEASSWIKSHKGPFGTLIGGKDEKGEKKELEGELKELSHAIRALKREKTENSIKISLDKIVLNDNTKSAAEKASAQIRINNYETRNLKVDLEINDKEGEKDDIAMKRENVIAEMLEHAKGGGGHGSGGSSPKAPSTPSGGHGGH